LFNFESLFIITSLFIFGAIWGSFANVIIYRLPLGQSVVTPRSYCASCNTTIVWYHNIPIFSWLFLRGKCAKCQTHFSIRYPLVELLMATLFAVAGICIGFQWFLLEALIFIFALVTASFIDIDHMILPDKFTLSGIVIGLLGAFLNPEREFISALYGVLMGGGFLWAVGYLYYVIRGREGMGGGDIKLLAWIGAVLGWRSIPVVILVSSVLGSVIGIMLTFRTKDGLQQPIPFGPYLAAATLLYLFLGGEHWADWYLSLHGL
jgi:leader peptidase (prepilin peptidase)/N-methyltransferase